MDKVNQQAMSFYSCALSLVSWWSSTKLPYQQQVLVSYLDSFGFTNTRRLTSMAPSDADFLLHTTFTFKDASIALLVSQSLTAVHHLLRNGHH